MKTILMLIVAACAALLFCSPAEAKLFHNRPAEVRVDVKIAPQAIVQPQKVTYQHGERRLRLGERIKARMQFSKSLRTLRVPTREAIVEQATLGE